MALDHPPQLKAVKKGVVVQPVEMAKKLMDIREQLALEWKEDLTNIQVRQQCALIFLCPPAGLFWKRLGVRSGRSGSSPVCFLSVVFGALGAHRHPASPLPPCPQRPEQTDRFLPSPHLSPSSPSCLASTAHSRRYRLAHPPSILRALAPFTWFAPTLPPPPPRAP